MTFDQIHIPEDADEALAWATEREFEMRYERMRRSRLGLAGGIKKATESMQRLVTAISGDPEVPA